MLDLAGESPTRPRCSTARAWRWSSRSRRCAPATPRRWRSFELGGHPLTLRGEEVGLGERESVEDVARTLAATTPPSAPGSSSTRSWSELAQAVGAGRQPAVRRRPPVPGARRPADPAPAVRSTRRPRRSPTSATATTWPARLGLAAAMTWHGHPAGLPAGLRTGRGRPRPFAAPRCRALGDEPSGGGGRRRRRRLHRRLDVHGPGGARPSTRRQAFEGFIVDGPLMAAAPGHAVFLHCLPAHRGEEVAGDVVDGRQSVVWQQAENRLHAVRGLLPLAVRRDARKTPASAPHRRGTSNRMR